MEIEKLKLALTAYGDDLQLYANGIAEDALSELAQTEDKIKLLAAELFEEFAKRGIRPDKETLEYIENLKEKIAEIRSDVLDESMADIQKDMAETAKTANTFWKLFFAAAGIKAVLLNQTDLANISKYGIYNGNTVSQILEKLKTGDTQRIFDTLSDALQKGATLKEAWSEVKRELKNTRRFVKSEVDALINGAANDTAIGFALKNKRKLRYTAVMDKKVCGKCKDLNGKLFDADSPDLPVLPRHYNCRCQLIPEGGVEPASFAEYINSMSKTEQRKRLGNAKYNGFSSGSYTLARYEEPLPGQKKELADIIEHTGKLLDA